MRKLVIAATNRQPADPVDQHVSAAQTQILVRLTIGILTRYNRTWNFGLYGHAESKKTQKFVLRSALRPNQISFSHGQDPKATLCL